MFHIRFFMLMALITLAFGQDLVSPENKFGFQMGEDRQLLNWEQLTGYFKQLDAASERLQVVELGRTTLDRPMLMLIISSEENLKKLGQYQDIQAKLARPYDVDEGEAEALIERGKAVCLITMNIHSNEIAASQEAPELAYDLITREDERAQLIRKNVITLIIPSLNPDGQDMISKWYMKHVGSRFEGTPMPHKYHHYADHDNNRDWFFFNLKESRHTAKVLYHDWYPEIVMDQHQMGGNRARFFLPPYSDPVNPNVAPSLSANVNLLGKYMLAEMHDQGLTGLVSGTIFNAYFEGTMSKTPLWQNRIGILTEAASTRYATPLFYPRSGLRGMGIDLPEYKQQTNFLDPWPGGWWRLRDIVEYQKAAALSMLGYAAIHREKVLNNFYRLNREAIEGDFTNAPQAYVIPADQADPGNAIEMLRRLRIANVLVQVAKEDFSVGHRNFKAGDFIIPLAQPARAYVKDLMEVQHYPDLRQYPGGPPRQPYDVTAWTLPLQMGVEAIAAAQLPSFDMDLVENPQLPESPLTGNDNHVLLTRQTHAFAAVNELLKNSATVLTLHQAFKELPLGSFLVRRNQLNDAEWQGLADRYQVKLQTVSISEREITDNARKIKASRIAIYQPWIPNVYDEGWTRWVFDQFGFSYRVLHNADFKNSDLLQKEFDVLILSSQRAESIVDGRHKAGEKSEPGDPEVAPEYRGGISKIGVQNIGKFVQNGGRLICLGSASDFAIESLKLPAQNVLKGLDRSDYFIPGSLLRMELKGDHRLTAGMANDAAVYMNSPVSFSLSAYPYEIGELGYFRDHDLLLSGWAVGEKQLYDKTGLAQIPLGKGSVLLYGFRPQHRAQTYGTFKLLFNALYLDR